MGINRMVESSASCAKLPPKRSVALQVGLGIGAFEGLGPMNKA